MSFIKSLKRAFGFSSSDEDLDMTESEHSSLQPNERVPYINPFKKETATTIQQTTTKKEQLTITEEEISSITISNELMEGILNIINSSLPEFIRSGIDIETERKYFIETLEPELLAHAEKIKEGAVYSNSSKWETKISALKDNISSLETTIEENRKLIADSKLAQSSLERQKQALSDRVKDLEEKAMKGESEVEQYILENKSLLNKLKVSQVKLDDVEYFKNENSRLQQELQELKTSGNIVDAISVEKHQTELLEIGTQLEMSKAMLEDFRVRHAEKERELIEKTNDSEALKIQLDELKKQIEANISPSEEIKEKDVEISDLHAKIKIYSVELEAAQSELEQANEALEVVAEVEAQLEKVEEMKQKKDAKIASLTEKLIIRDQEINDLKNEIGTLKDTIEQNLIDYAQNIQNIKPATPPARTRVASTGNTEVWDMTVLDDDLIAKEAPAVEYNAGKPSVEEQEENNSPVFSAIDNSDEDWLISPAFEDIFMKDPDPEPEVIIETKPKPFIDDSAQLSLF